MRTRVLKIQVASNAEFEAIERAIREPDVLAFLKVVGYLKPLNHRQAERVLRFVGEALQESEKRV